MNSTAGINAKRVLVTGAAGSIGSAICRCLAQHRVDAVLGIDLRPSEIPPGPHVAALGVDIRKRQDVLSALLNFRPHVVFHAAALKDVPALQTQPFAAVESNVFGTVNLVAAARKAAVEQLVLLSTDKAVRPISVMGATKRLCELLFRELEGPTKFVAVRLGNVWGSSRSVVPTLQAQLAQGGPLTVTHRDMRRYFITVEQAVNVTLRAMSTANNNEVAVPDMGEPVQILQLAEDLLQGHPDVQVKFTGIRPGEKLSEELWDSDSEEFLRSQAGLSFYRHRPHNAWQSIAAVRNVYVTGDEAALVRTLHHLSRSGAVLGPIL